jgi:hypothetical protein
VLIHSAHGGEPIEGIHYQNPEYMHSSLDDLIALSSNHIGSHIEDHCLVILEQEGIYTKNNNRPMVNPYMVRKVIAIGRNRHGQIYEVKNLQSSLHFAVPVKVASEIAFRVQFFFGGCTETVPYIYVSSEAQLYSDQVSNIYVQNNNPKFVPPSASKLSQLNNPSMEKMVGHAMKAVECGLLTTLKPTSGGDQRPPNFSAGWTMSNCLAYPESRINDAMNVGPWQIAKDFDKLSVDSKQHLLKAFDTALRLLPNKHNTFKINSNKSRMDMRKQLNMDLFNVVYDENDEPIGPWMSCEAFTVVIPTNLPAHRDALNDSKKGTNWCIWSFFSSKPEHMISQ